MQGRADLLLVKHENSEVDEGPFGEAELALPKGTLAEVECGEHDLDMSLPLPHLLLEQLEFELVAGTALVVVVHGVDLVAPDAEG